MIRGSWWLLTPFPAPAAKVVKSILNVRKVKTSILALEREAYVKSSWINDEGTDTKWARIVNGERTYLSPGEAARLGLEKVSLKVQVIVSDQPALADFLVEKGIAEDDVIFVKEATADDVRGKHVAGDLPFSLASVARSVTTVELRDLGRLEGKTLKLKQVRKHVGDVRRYNVEEGL